MRHPLRKLAIFLLFMFTYPLNAFAWNALGHMVVADIAYQHLKPEVREKANDLITFLHQEYPTTSSFMQIATWPDMIRYQKIETFTHWHYIDLPFTDGTSPMVNTIDSDNAVWAIGKLETIVKNSNANSYERGRFLAFLVHIVGDLHQPLHTVSRITKRTPDGDAGGNKIHVKIDGKRLNLHTVWDKGAGVFEGSGTPEKADVLAKQITARYPEKYFGDRVNDLNPENWAKEGMENAKRYVYDIEEDKEVSDAYIDQGKKVAEQEAALAGYRLAALLNKLLA